MGREVRVHQELVEHSVLNHGLTFLATVAFVIGFFGSRLDTTLHPGVVVVVDGIHFHHFWYGLAMITFAGWSGIALKTDQFDRSLAVIFGLGAGIMGDEVGLLLTFGDYDSSLTEIFFVGAIAFVIIITLLSRARKQLDKDVFNVGGREWLSLVGVFVAFFSTVFLADGSLEVGALVAGAGALLFLFGFDRNRRSTGSRFLGP